MKYWVYMNGEVPGSFSPEELVGLQGFSGHTLVCPAEGEIVEKNWRRSGEFADIIAQMHARDARQPPSAPTQPADVVAADVGPWIDAASSRLFSSVATLMRELEAGREERALTQSLQRQLVDLKQQLARERERASMLESRMPRLGELEEAVRKDMLRIEQLETALKEHETALGELRLQHERARTELEANRRRLGEALNDLSIRNRLVDRLSRDLSDKELSLTKTLGVIRRLEEDMHRLVPPPAGVAPYGKAPGAMLPVGAAETDSSFRDAGPVERAPAAETAPAPAPETPPAPGPEQPAAHDALIDRLKKFIAGDVH